MVDEAVDGGDRHGGIGKDVVPCREWLVGGDRERVSFVAMGDELEQGAGLDLILADVGQVVEYDEIELIELVEHFRQAEIAACGLELLGHIGGRAEQDAPPCVDQGMADVGVDQTVRDLTGSPLSLFLFECVDQLDG